MTIAGGVACAAESDPNSDPITTSTADSGSTSRATDGSSAGPTTTDATTTGSGSTAAADTTGDADTGINFDLAPPPDADTKIPDQCTVSDDMDGVGTCDDVAPPESFAPEIQWEWEGPAPNFGSYTPPLVANLTDDNDDGVIDLCDTPDVAVVVLENGGQAALYVLDGATGTEHFGTPAMLELDVVPAIGDIDDDGIPEILAGTSGSDSQIVAFEHDGTLKWTSTASINHGQGFAIALADIDHDGDVEIIADDTVLDHDGNTLWVAPEQAGWSLYDIWHCTATTVADLDGDDDMEIILGQTAYRNDGTPYYNVAIEPGFPQVANLDGDPQPEILVTTRQGLNLIEHDGTLTWTNQTPTGDPSPGWFRPATVHDFDGDTSPEFAASSASHYSVIETDLSILWTANVQDNSGWSAGTAFDFLGDGTAEAMYTDEVNLFVFDEAGDTLFSVPRTSPTLIEYPTVADVDNDGSAEILVVSWGAPAPTLQVIRDVEDRWIQARRIWNQHTYHVTNVREDGTIPQFEPRSWEQLNTFRTNAQIQGGSVCNPDPAG